MGVGAGLGVTSYLGWHAVAASSRAVGAGSDWDLRPCSARPEDPMMLLTRGPGGNADSANGEVARWPVL
jgi:hypothetical protein